MTDAVPAVVLPVDRMAALSLQGTASRVFENAGMKREGAYVCTAGAGGGMQRMLGILGWARWLQTFPPGT